MGKRCKTKKIKHVAYAYKDVFADCNAYEECYHENGHCVMDGENAMNAYQESLTKIDALRMSTKISCCVSKKNAKECSIDVDVHPNVVEDNEHYEDSIETSGDWFCTYDESQLHDRRKYMLGNPLYEEDNNVCNHKAGLIVTTESAYAAKLKNLESRETLCAELEVKLEELHASFMIKEEEYLKRMRILESRELSCVHKQNEVNALSEEYHAKMIDYDLKHDALQTKLCSACEEVKADCLVDMTSMQSCIKQEVNTEDKKELMQMLKSENANLRKQNESINVLLYDLKTKCERLDILLRDQIALNLKLHSKESINGVHDESSMYIKTCKDDEMNVDDHKVHAKVLLDKKMMDENGEENMGQQAYYASCNKWQQDDVDFSIRCTFCWDYGHPMSLCPHIQCKSCYEYGHRSKECPYIEEYYEQEEDDEYYDREHSTSYARAFYGSCFSCGAYGHRARDCNSYNLSFCGTCYTCGAYGHRARNCNGYGKMYGYDRRYNKRVCFYCSKPGHVQRGCYKKQRDEDCYGSGYHITYVRPNTCGYMLKTGVKSKWHANEVNYRHGRMKKEQKNVTFANPMDEFVHDKNPKLF